MTQNFSVLTQIFILHSFLVQYVSRVRVGKILLHIVIQRPRLPHQVASPSPRAREPCAGLSVGKEGGGHGAVAWKYYRPDLNMADFISGHTVHWPELVTRHT